METYVKKALFVYSEEGEMFVPLLLENTLGVKITVVAYNDFVKNQEKSIKDYNHVVVSGSFAVIKLILHLAVEHKISVGIIPLPSQKQLIHSYDLPKDSAEAVKCSLQASATAVDLIYCNKEIMLFKAAIGRVPLLDAPAKKRGMTTLFQAFKRLRGLKLLKFNFITENKRKIETAAAGCMIIQHHEGTLASKLVSHNSSLADGMVSLVITAPFSIIDYLKFLFHVFTRTIKRGHVISTIGLIKSPEIKIESEQELRVLIDDETACKTPLHCKALPKAVKINVGEKISSNTTNMRPTEEKISIKNLPTGKELIKAANNVVPFFSYASEERFKDLFTALHKDSKLNSIYVVLMILSTMLATVGLYLNSSAVIIGAMLLAPLMAPIISFSMGLLRNNSALIKNSFIKIIVGISLALLSAAIITNVLPYDPVTPEMQARLNPSLLDLAVAIIAGIAGAYTKSFKEILQSLAGVAIAVALVPPLAVAGEGLGRMDLQFFMQAFLLFSTNLIGIILAANITFRILGYSAAIRDRKKIVYISILLGLIAIPLYLTYQQIIKKYNFEEAWRHERFFVNGKYLIINKAHLLLSFDKEVLVIDIFARERLTREDMAKLKRRIQSNFSKKLLIRAKITYIL